MSASSSASSGSAGAQPVVDDVLTLIANAADLDEARRLYASVRAGSGMTLTLHPALSPTGTTVECKHTLPNLDGTPRRCVCCVLDTLCDEFGAHFDVNLLESFALSEAEARIMVRDAVCVRQSELAYMQKRGAQPVDFDCWLRVVPYVPPSRLFRGDDDGGKYAHDRIEHAIGYALSQSTLNDKMLEGIYDCDFSRSPSKYALPPLVATAVAGNLRVCLCFLQQKDMHPMVFLILAHAAALNKHVSFLKAMLERLLASRCTSEWDRECDTRLPVDKLLWRRATAPTISLCVAVTHALSHMNTTGVFATYASIYVHVHACLFVAILLHEKVYQAADESGVFRAMEDEYGQLDDDDRHVVLNFLHVCWNTFYCSGNLAAAKRASLVAHRIAHVLPGSLVIPEVVFGRDFPNQMHAEENNLAPRMMTFEPTMSNDMEAFFSMGCRQASNPDTGYFFAECNRTKTEVYCRRALDFAAARGLLDLPEAIFACFLSATQFAHYMSRPFTLWLIDFMAKRIAEQRHRKALFAQGTAVAEYLDNFVVSSQLYQKFCASIDAGRGVHLYDADRCRLLLMNCVDVVLMLFGILCKHDRCVGDEDEIVARMLDAFQVTPAAVRAHLTSTNSTLLCIEPARLRLYLRVLQYKSNEGCAMNNNAQNYANYATQYMFTANMQKPGHLSLPDRYMSLRQVWSSSRPQPCDDLHSPYLSEFREYIERRRFLNEDSFALMHDTDRIRDIFRLQTESMESFGLTTDAVAVYYMRIVEILEVLVESGASLEKDFADVPLSVAAFPSNSAQVICASHVFLFWMLHQRVWPRVAHGAARCRRAVIDFIKKTAFFQFEEHLASIPMLKMPKPSSGNACAADQWDMLVSACPRTQGLRPESLSLVFFRLVVKLGVFDERTPAESLELSNALANVLHDAEQCGQQAADGKSSPASAFLMLVGHLMTC